MLSLSIFIRKPLVSSSRKTLLISCRDPAVAITVKVNCREPGLRTASQAAYSTWDRPYS